MARRSISIFVVLSCMTAVMGLAALTGCGDDDDVTRRDSGSADASVPIDTGALDMATADSAVPPPPPADAGRDGAVTPEDAEPAPVDGSTADVTAPGEDAGDPADAGLPGGDCATDDDCLEGAEWCTGGRCVPCDNSGARCDIDCVEGFSTYERHGCSPCACAPISNCDADDDCGAGNRCYPGRQCWDWCPPGDPTCCLGSFCDRAGCMSDPPLACTFTGCPEGQECRLSSRCLSSECFCSEGGAWGCTRDCIRYECQRAM